VIGFDDTVSAPYLTPPLTVVRQPIRLMGQRAADRLLRHLQSVDAGNKSPATELLPMEIVSRESVGPPRSKEFSLAI
jgi:DNA-binding LacI/PurR family transcriptional regulator